MITDLKETKENKIVTNMSDVENELSPQRKRQSFKFNHLLLRANSSKLMN